MWLTFAIVLPMCGCQGDTPEKGPTRSDATTNVNAEDLASLTYAAATEHHNPAGRVKVEVSSAWGEGGLLIVRATFTPDDSGYHLYSNTLPREGVSGLGRPTLIEVANPEQFSQVGPAVSNQESTELVDDVLNLTFPVYPDGPVTLYLPLQFKSVPTAESQISLNLTYMACSKTNCHRPVEGALVEITAPAPSASSG